ncbi:MAG: hypothetical protein Tsb007_15070 [Rhizobacter sp.]
MQSASAAIDALANAGILRGLPYMGYLKNAPSTWGAYPSYGSSLPDTPLS